MKHYTYVEGNQGGVYAYCATCNKTLLQGDHAIWDYRKACKDHIRETMVVSLLLKREEALYLIEDLRHAANYGTDWDGKLNSFADSLERQIKYDIEAQ